MDPPLKAFSAFASRSETMTIQTFAQFFRRAKINVSIDLVLAVLQKLAPVSEQSFSQIGSFSQKTPFCS